MIHRSSKMLIALTTTLALSLALVACGDDGDDAGDDSDDSTTEVATRVVTLDGTPTDGPDEYDTITVVQQGPEDAENVLVLAPGTSAGAAYFLPLGEDLVRELDGWQVWSIDRRENLLEDHDMINARKVGDATTQESFDYYLGWIADPEITDHFEAPTDDEVAFARDWGMAVAVEDVDIVVDEALDLGGDVVLGGHSLGGSITVAYATWDFDGTPGAEKLSGIVLIDGGSGAGQAPTVEEAQASLAELETESPFNDLLGLGLPWAPGVFNVLGSTGVLLEPDEPSIAYDFDLLPAALKPPVQPTNTGQYGYALDVDTSPEYLGLVHLSMGELAAEGDPRGWVDDGAVPIERAATMFSGIENIDGTSWYHPVRLSIDSGSVNGGNANPAQEVFGVRAIHGDALTIPIYAFETGFGAGRVSLGAEMLAQQSNLSEDQVTIVIDHDVTHTDPMGIEPDNPLVETLVPFLAAIA